MVQELADRDALRERRGVAVQVEQPLRDELNDERGDEDLRHAPDAEAVIDCECLARSQVCEAGRCLYPFPWPQGDCDSARNAGRNDSVELILDRFHLVGGQPNDEG